MRVSVEIDFLDLRRAVVQDLGLRKMGRVISSVDADGSVEPRRAVLDAASRLPMW